MLSALIVRRVVDHLNHDELVGGEGGGGGIPEPPVTGQTFGRAAGGWYPVLPLTGNQVNQVQGPLLVPFGSRGAPGLMLGANDSGFWRSQTIVYLNTSGSECMAWTPDLIASWKPLNMGDKPIQALADATQSPDALNLRTADRRYAAPGPWADFPADPGWTSTLRYRAHGPALMLEGGAAGPLPANARARIGILPAGVRPAHAVRFPAVASMGLAFGWAMMETGRRRPALDVGLARRRKPTGHHRGYRIFPARLKEAR